MAKTLLARLSSPAYDSILLRLYYKSMLELGKVSVGIIVGAVLHSCFFS